jgi:spermidine/putrescine transport system substrate-binding protein
MKRSCVKVRLAAIALALASLVGLARPIGAAPEKELNLFAWSEYIPQSVLDGFKAETGIVVHYETFSSGEEMLAKILAGASSYDLIQPPDYIAEALIKNGLVAPLDFSKLPHFSGILPQFRNLPFDPKQSYTVPYMAGISGIVYNSDKVNGPVRGYRDLFSARHAGRIVVIDDGRELVQAALYTLGYGTNEINPTTLAKARPLLAEWFKRVKLFDSDSPKTALLNGDVDIGFVWCGEAAILLNQNTKFRFVLPEEGIHASVDVLAIPLKARHVEAAYRLMDYLLRPEVSKRISDAFPYMNPNGEARKLLSPEQLANPASYPAIDKPLDTFRHLGQMNAAIDELITDLKNSR